MTVLYNAGIFTSNFDLEGTYCRKLRDQYPEYLKLRAQNEYFLESYHYIQKEAITKKIRKEGKKVFLDSGAFSAYNTGVSIDLGRYCDYIHKNQDIIQMAAGLDVIDFDNPARAAKESFRNLKEMERRGVKALPAFHQGEPEEALEYYVANYDYVLLGGLVGSSAKVLQAWLDHIFEKYITNSDGTLKTKIHLFGVTSLPLMLRYNATSVDSSTWVQWAAYGSILLPRSGRQISISAQSPSKKQVGLHYLSIRDIERESLAEEIRSYGVDPQAMVDLNIPRWAFNTWAFPQYLKLRSELKSDTFKATEQGLF
jgi:hypothetical protein